MFDDITTFPEQYYSDPDLVPYLVPKVASLNILVCHLFRK
jgi:hypothetical protein